MGYKAEEATLTKLDLPKVWLACLANGYVLESRIGRGSFGLVVLATCNKTKTPVAIKMITNFQG